MSISKAWSAAATPLEWSGGLQANDIIIDLPAHAKVFALIAHSPHIKSSWIKGGIVRSGHQMLQVQDVCKTFDGGRGALEVLRDIRFNVAAGEFMSIIGPSGCGKTTLLRIVHGLEPATSGAFRFEGRRVAAPSRRAIIFQQFNLFPWRRSRKTSRSGWKWQNSRPRMRRSGRRFIRLVGLGGF